MNTLSAERRVSYDDLWATALSEPMTWESDLKTWIREWQNDRLEQIEGMTSKQSVPQREKRNFLVWRGK